MSILLEDLVKKWKRVPKYSDVEAQYWETNQPQVETCPHGCNIKIYENTPTKWARVSGHDLYRQTRICRKHGFTRIYITAQANNWNPQLE